MEASQSRSRMRKTDFVVEVSSGTSSLNVEFDPIDAIVSGAASADRAFSLAGIIERRIHDSRGKVFLDSRGSTAGRKYSWADADSLHIG